MAIYGSAIVVLWQRGGGQSHGNAWELMKKVSGSRTVVAHGSVSLWRAMVLPWGLVALPWERKR